MGLAPGIVPYLSPQSLPATDLGILYSPPSIFVILSSLNY